MSTPRLGLTGALVATTISYGVGLVASILLGRLAQPLPLPWSALARTALATAAMGLAVVCLPNPGGVFELALKAGVGALVYGLAAFLLDVAEARTRARGFARSFACLRKSSKRKVRGERRARSVRCGKRTGRETRSPSKATGRHSSTGPSLSSLTSP